MIRPAKQTDATQIAPLLLVIWKDMELEIFKQEEETAILAALIEGIGLENYRYSYEHLHVYEQDEQIAGVLAGYKGEIEPTIDANWPELAAKHHLSYVEPIFKDKETFPGEWYLDSIVTNQAFQGQGIGTKLLAALPAIAQAEGENVIGLNCDQQNPRAKALYERNGFKKVSEIVIAGHRYDHMQKQL